MLTQPTTTEYATFEGVDVSALDPYAAEALLQATDLMAISLNFSSPGTVVQTTDVFLLRIMVRGICAMAEALTQGQAARALSALPFRSETIGSYSYSYFASKLSSGQATDIMWFDLAVRLLGGGVLDDNMIDSISIFERDFNGIGAETGRPYLIGPADQAMYYGPRRDQRRMSTWRGNGTG